MSTSTHYRAKVGALSRSRSESDPELVAARRDLKAAKLAEHITKLVDEAPPLTPEQRDRLAILLRSGDEVGQPYVVSPAERERRLRQQEERLRVEEE